MTDVSEITSDLPDQAAAQPAAEAAPATPPPALKDNEVQLSTGKIVGLRRLSGLDSSDLEQLMPEAGFKSADGLAQATYLRCCAAYAISTTQQADNGPVEQVMPPQTGGELRMRLGEYFEGDWGLLVGKYLEVNGQSPKASSDFRPTG